MCMGHRKRRTQLDQAEVTAPPVTAVPSPRRWGVVVGVVLAAVALAVFIDWRMSGWSSSVPLEPDETPVVASGAAAEPAPRLDNLFTPTQSHDELMAAMTRMAEQVVGAFPEDPTAYDLQGRIYAYLGKSAEAQRAWERCLQLEPRRPDACNGLATLAIKQGEDAAAEPLLRRASRSTTRCRKRCTNWPSCSHAPGAREEAAVVLQRYVERTPTATDGLLTLAQTQLQLGRLDDAARNFAAVIAQRPASGEAYLGLGTVLTRRAAGRRGRRWRSRGNCWPTNPRRRRI